MKVNLSQQCWQRIKIKNTIIAGGNFFKSNLTGSEFENVRIDGINLNKAILFDCKWKNIFLNELHECKGHKDRINQVCFSKDGWIFGSAGNDGWIILWDLKTGKQQLKKKMKGQIKLLIFSPDNATLASGNKGGKIYLQNYRQGKIKSLLNGHNDRVTSVCFSPDGAILASGSRDKTIHLWDVCTGVLKSQLNGHSDYVTSVCFSPDGATLASCSQDKTIRLWDLWDVSNGELKSSHNLHNDQDTSVSLSTNDHFCLQDQMKICQIMPIQCNYYLTTQQFMLSSKIISAHPYVTKVFISQQNLIQAHGALVFQGQISNHLGINFKQFLLHKQSIILDQFLK